METAAEDDAYRVAKMTADMQLQFQNCLSNADTEATTWSLADTAHVTNQLEREIYGITLNEQKWLEKEFSIRLLEFEAWSETIGIQVLRNTIEPHIIQFGYPNMHLVSHISESIRRMDSGDNSTSDNSEWLPISNMKGAYRSSNKVKYIQQMLMHNDQCTGLHYMGETLSYLALQGWYTVDFAKVFNLLPATDNQLKTCRTHVLHLETIQDKPFIHPSSQQVYHPRETHVR